MKKKIIALGMLLPLFLVSCGKSNVEPMESGIPQGQQPGQVNPFQPGGDTPAGSSSNVDSTGVTSGVTLPEATEVSDTVDVSQFSITTKDGSYSNTNGVFTITKGGSYDLSGILENGQIVIQVEEANDKGSYDVEINLNGVTLKNKGTAIYAKDSSQDYEVDISAKSGTKNYIYDLSEEDGESREEDAAIYATCDLQMKGKGELSIYGSYNGIHTKDDLSLKNLTLVINAKNHALKGNDSVEIESGTYTLVSTGGDGIKTSNSALSSKGNQKGNVEITGGDISIYSACDGIDAAYDVNISNEAKIHIYTSNYSSYTSDVVATTSSTLYIRINGRGMSSYRYVAYFYNDESDGKWVEAKASSSGRDMIYSLDKPSGYSNVVFYIFSSSENSTTNYVYKSKESVIHTTYDMVTLDTRSSSVSWGSYTANQGPGFGGGFNSGNSNKSEWSAKGIKSDNQILITGGDISISAYDDALHANNDTTIESTNSNGVGNITISGGVLSLVASDDAIHADQDIYIQGTSDITVSSSYEGIEANRIYFENGKVDVYATDDAVNAAKCNGSYTPIVYMKGGYVSLEVGSGDTDTLDSNGNVEISGGTLILKNQQSSATSFTGGTMDLDGTLNITGGTVLSFGCWCTEAKMNTFVTNTNTTLSKGSYSLCDSNGNAIISLTLQGNCKGYRFYSKELSSGSYSLKKENTTINTFNI